MKLRCFYLKYRCSNPKDYSLLYFGSNLLKTVYMAEMSILRFSEYFCEYLNKFAVYKTAICIEEDGIISWNGVYLLVLI